MKSFREHVDIVLEGWTKEPGYTMVNPVKHSNTDRIWDSIDAVDDAYHAKIGKYMHPKQLAPKYGKKMSVPINKITCTEKYLNPDKVQAIVDGEKTNSSELPIFYFVKGRYIAGDGNHRIAAEQIKGSTTVSGHVLSLDFLSNTKKK